MGKPKFKVFKYDETTHPGKPWVVITPERDVVYMRDFSDVLAFVPWAIKARSF